MSRGRAALAFVLAVIACGQTLPASTDETSAPKRDAGVSDDGSIDAAPSTRCSLDTPFAPRVLRVDVADPAITNNRYGAVLDETESKLFFSYAAGGKYRIAYATRSAGEAIAFEGAVSLVSNAADHDGYPWISPDAQRLYFSTTRSEPNFDIFRVNVATVPGQTVLAGAAPIIATPDFEKSLSLTADERELVYTSGSGIRHGTLNDATFTADDLASKLLTTGDGGASQENHPVISADGLVIYFGSVRDGFDDGTRIYRATRTRRDEPFANVEREPSLFNFLSGEPSFISRDLCRLYFFAYAGVGATEFTLYVGEREPAR